MIFLVLRTMSDFLVLFGTMMKLSDGKMYQPKLKFVISIFRILSILCFTFLGAVANCMIILEFSIDV